MTTSVLANTVIEDASPIQKASYIDYRGKIEEVGVDWPTNFIRCRFHDWQETALEFLGIHEYAPMGTAVDLAEVSSQHFFRSPIAMGKILRITDAYNTVADFPSVKVSDRRPQVYTQAEASTTGEGFEEFSNNIVQQERTRYVYNAINRLFESAGELYFEDGMETDFSRELVSLVKKYDYLAMEEINYLITCGRVNGEVASEALRWLARINDQLTYGWRLWILEKSLFSESPMVRDAAGLGLACMGDAHAIVYIKKAIDKETIAELRYDLQRSLKDLEDSLNVVPVKGNTQA